MVCTLKSWFSMAKVQGFILQLQGNNDSHIKNINNASEQQRGYLEHDHTSQNSQWCKHNIVYRGNNSCVECVKSLHEREREREQLENSSIMTTKRNENHKPQNVLTSNWWKSTGYILIIRFNYKINPEAGDLFQCFKLDHIVRYVHVHQYNLLAKWILV